VERQTQGLLMVVKNQRSEIAVEADGKMLVASKPA
jgi:hypothetical protein